MKRTLLTGGLFLAGLSLFAQSNHFLIKGLPSSQRANKHRVFVNSLLEHQLNTVSGAAQKPTGVQQRVIAQTNIEINNGIPNIQDTMTFKYSNTRGSKYNHNVIDDLGYRSYFTSDYLSGPYFEMSAKKNDVLADTITYFDENGPYEFDYAYYRTDNKIDSFFSTSNANSIFKTIQKYNANGTISQYLELNNFVNPAVFDSSRLHKFWYNTAGDKLLKDTLYEYDIANFNPYYTTTYHYDAQNRLDSIIEYENTGTSFDLSLLTVISYDASDRVIKTRQTEYNSFDTTTYTTIDTLGYTGNLSFYTYYESRSYGSNEESSIKIIKHIGTNSQPDSAAFYMSDDGTNYEMLGALKYSYNTFNNPVSVIGKDADGEIIGRYNFYYETYDDGNNVGIKNVAAGKAVSTYPNPFSNVINIDWKENKMQAKISLVNMVGQIVFSSNKYLTTGNNSIDISGISNGNYILLIQDEQGNTYNSKKLSKK